MVKPTSSRARRRRQDAPRDVTQPNEDEASSEKKPYVNAYKRAEQTYKKIQEERKEAAEARRREREQREQKHEEYLSLKKKMNKALKKRTKKGQPKLGAQMDVLLEKIERKMKD